MTEQELEMCVSQYGKDIYSFCKYLTGNSHEADDLYQDTFLKAVERKEKIDYEQNSKSYLLSIVLRVWKNKKRKYAWRKRIVDVQPIIDEKNVDMNDPTALSLEEKLDVELDENFEIKVTEGNEKGAEVAKFAIQFVLTKIGK